MCQQYLLNPAADTTTQGIKAWKAKAKKVAREASTHEVSKDSKTRKEKTSLWQHGIKQGKAKAMEESGKVQKMCK